MRWQGLFEDLEAQAAALEVAERGAEIEERTRAETAQLALVDRLRPAVGLDLKLRCRGGLVLAGRPALSGLGRALMLTAIRALRGMHFQELTLTVTSVNANAVHLYEQLGFRTIRSFIAGVWPG